MLTYGGVELLFPDAECELWKWLREHQNLDDTLEFCDPRLTELSPRRGLQNWYGVRKGIGQTIGTYPKAPPPRLNTLYWPTGASRWSRGFFLATGTAKNAIVAQAHSAGGNTALLLKMGDDSFNLETRMYLLPPRVVSNAVPTTEALWILPLVDVRYWWQELSVDDLEVTTSTTWSNLLATLGTKLGATISVPTAVTAAYLQPDPIEFTRRYSNAAAMLDAAALSVGKRVVRWIDGTVRAESAADAVTSNLNGDWQLICGGGVSDPPPSGAVPAKVVTTFRKWRDYALLDKGRVYVESIDAPDGNALFSGSEKIIHSTAFANCTDDDDSPSNTSDLNTLATAIADDHYDWLRKSHDYTFANIKPWKLTGFDDSVVWNFGYQGDSGKYQAQTRIQSLPPDFGFDLQLSQFSTMGLFEPVRLGKPDSDIAKGDSGTVSVWEGRAGSRTDSTINVTGWATGAAVTADKWVFLTWIENDWEVTPYECGGE